MGSLSRGRGPGSVGNKGGARFADPTATDAFPETEDGRLDAHMSRHFSAANVERVRAEVMPDALKRGDADLAAKCEAVLRKHKIEVPNRLTGKWGPADVPRSELHLREMFAHRLPEFGLRVVRSRDAFPDYLLLNDAGLFVRAEAEFRSSSFTRHGHDPSGVDLIVCWEHDDHSLDVPVLEWFAERLYGEPEGHDDGALVWAVPQRVVVPRSVLGRGQAMSERREELMRSGLRAGEAAERIAEEFGVKKDTVYQSISRYRRNANT